jgi:hypothetical protein
MIALSCFCRKREVGYIAFATHGSRNIFSVVGARIYWKIPWKLQQIFQMDNYHYKENTFL